MKPSVQPSVVFKPQQYSQIIGNFGAPAALAALAMQPARLGGFPIGAPYFRESGQSPLQFGGK